MAQDLLLAALVIDKRREPDYEAAERAIAALEAADVTGPLSFGDDPEEPGGLEEIRRVLREDLQELEEALGSSPEIVGLSVRGATVHVTGGWSWGESPTDLWGVIDRLRAVRGVLAAAGFEGEE